MLFLIAHSSRLGPPVRSPRFEHPLARDAGTTARLAYQLGRVRFEDQEAHLVLRHEDRLDEVEPGALASELVSRRARGRVDLADIVVAARGKVGLDQESHPSERTATAAWPKRGHPRSLS